MKGKKLLIFGLVIAAVLVTAVKIGTSNDEGLASPFAGQFLAAPTKIPTPTLIPTPTPIVFNQDSNLGEEAGKFAPEDFSEDFTGLKTEASNL